MKEFFPLLFVFLFTVNAFSESFEDIKKRYPPSSAYIVGIAEVVLSGDAYKDRRRSEILARLEIATQIKVTVKKTTVDVMCEGDAGGLFKKEAECLNEFVMIVEESVDEVLKGSRIVETGEDRERGVYWAVAILPRKEAALKAEEGVTQSIEKTKEHIDKAKITADESTKKEEVELAKEELLRGMAFDGEKKAIEETRERAEGIFKELAGEIEKLEGR